MNGTSKKAPGKVISPGFFINPGKSLSLLLLLLSLNITSPEKVNMLNIYKINYIKISVFSFSHNVFMLGFQSIFYYYFYLFL